MAERRVTAKEYHDSGLTLKEFAADRGLTLSTLTRWLHEVRRWEDRRPQETVQFHSMALPVLAWAAEVQRPSGSVIRFQANTPPELAAIILEACP